MAAAARRWRPAGRDPLTGLAGPALFPAASQRSLDHGARSGRHSAVLLIELNDAPEQADEVLVTFARLLRGCVPPTGLPVRLDGDRFAVVLPDLAFGEQAYEVAGRIAAALGPIVAARQLVTLAAAVGVAVAAPGELTHDEIVHRATAAMLRAKQHGPDTRWAAWPQPDAA
ncbi:MAG: GGDEF domain-containing protein [Actinoplanes sp.]